MNILKLKSILFSLLTITFFAISLTSCEKEPIENSASDSEVINELFRLASNQIDFSTSDANELSVTLTEDDLSPSVLKAFQEQSISINEDIVIKNSKDLFCSIEEDCPLTENFIIESNSNSITSRGCFSVCVNDNCLTLCLVF